MDFMTSVSSLWMLFASATQLTAEPLQEPAAFEAVVHHVSNAPGGQTQLSVKQVRAVNDSATYPESTVVHVHSGTKVFMQKGPALKEVSATEIKTGDRVRVWVDATLRSDPPQYSAGRITIEPREK